MKWLAKSKAGEIQPFLFVCLQAVTPSSYPAISVVDISNKILLDMFTKYGNI